MPEPLTLAATPTRLTLLRCVEEGLVADDADYAPMLDLGDGETGRVAEAIWEMRRADWVDQPTTDGRWHLTGLGRRVLGGA